MKKNYFLTLLIALCVSAFSFGQGSENFANSNATSSYADNSFVGNNGITWTYVKSRDANGDTNSSGIALPALMLQKSAVDSKVTSSTISGGIGDFSVKLYKGFTGGGNRQVELFVNGVSKGVSEEFDDYNEHIFTVTGINVTGDVIIELKNTTAKQVIVDDISWTAPSTDPSISIITPKDNAVVSAGKEDEVQLTIALSISNFTLSGDNGSEQSDNTGDGYIVGNLKASGEADGFKNLFTTTPDPATVQAGKTYTITAELVDNSGASLSPKVEASITFTVEYPCKLELGEIKTTCDALTTGTDTYSATIAFTGGNTGDTYTISGPPGVTVGGDNPNTTAAGTITFTGLTEGDDGSIRILGGTGSSCDYEKTLNSPICVAFPVVDMFNYNADTDLMASPLWQNNSNSSDEIRVVAATMGNPFSAAQFPDPTGNMVSFDGSGSDSYIGFNQQNSGTIYTSFLFTATDVSGLTKAGGGYFAYLANASGSFRSRIWLQQDAGDNTKYNVGISAASSGATYNTALAHTPGEEVFVVVSYNFTTNDLKLWVNPDPASFGGSAPAETLKVTASGSDIPVNLGRFGLRQDSGTETPPINFDELRISTTWADVAPQGTAAAVRENTIEGFAAYPNPVNNGMLTIKSSNSDEKNVTIYNVLGKRVFQQKFSGATKQLNVSHISSGIYIMKVIEGEKVATKKLVIK